MDIIRKDARNRINLDPDIWGEHGWIFLMSIGIGYPKKPTKEEQNTVHNLLSSLDVALPCNKCRRNYHKHLNTHRLTSNILSSRTSLLKWLIDVKNKINKHNGKRTYNYNETINYYYNILKNKNSRTTTKSYTILIMLLIAGLIFITWLLIDN